MRIAIEPPGPRSRLPGATLLRFRRDRLGFLLATARTHGDVAGFTLGRQPIYLVSDPAMIQDVLELQAASFTKGRALERARHLLGQGLLTSEGELHQRQRRLVMPAFHKQRLAGYGATMVALARAHGAAWQPGRVVDVATEMMHLTRAIVAKTLFDHDVADDAGEIDAAMGVLVGSFGSVALFLPEWVVERGLWPSAARLEAARATLDATIYGMIAARRAEGRDHGDLLSMLLAAVDEDGDGRGMSDRQLRDEVMTLFLAGHETTANALAWTWFLLAEHPEVDLRLDAELDRVLAGRPPTLDDLPALPYTRMVFTEAMRLYPPAWLLGRRAARDCSVGGFGIPRGAVVLMSQWVVHHDPRLYPDPFRFDPERWAADVPARPKYAYFPFGGGPRRCIGEAFAWTEGLLVLATLAQGWRMRLVPGHPVVPEPLITLRPRHGIRAVLERRAGARGPGEAKPAARPRAVA